MTTGRVDAFDALREADTARKSWVAAARAFTRLLDRVVDPNSVKHLERQWGEAVAEPLPSPTKAWELVDWARDAVNEDMPLTFQEMAQHDDLTVEDVRREYEKWRSARNRRDEEVEREVEKYLAGDFSGS